MTQVDLKRLKEILNKQTFAYDRVVAVTGTNIDGMKEVYQMLPEIVSELENLRAAIEEFQYTRPHYYPVSDPSNPKQPSDYASEANETWLKWRDAILTKFNLK